MWQCTVFPVWVSQVFVGTGTGEGSAEVGEVDSAGPRESATEAVPSEPLTYHLAERLPFSLPFTQPQGFCGAEATPTDLTVFIVQRP